MRFFYDCDKRKYSYNNRRWTKGKKYDSRILLRNLKWL